MRNRYRHESRLSERKFLQVLKCFTVDIASFKAAELCAVNKNTTHRFYGLLRCRVLELSLKDNQPLGGEVEIDESCFGAKRVKGKRGRGAAGKTPVVGLLKREGKVYVQIVEDCSRKQLMPIIKGQVLSTATIYTDGWKAYDSLITEGYQHHRIFHEENEFARGKNHVNGIESFWSYAKLRMAQKKGISKDAFLAHLLESQWRWNHRHSNTYLILKNNLLLSPLN